MKSGTQWICMAVTLQLSARFFPIELLQAYMLDPWKRWVHDRSPALLCAAQRSVVLYAQPRTEWRRGKPQLQYCMCHAAVAGARWRTDEETNMMYV